MKKGFRISHGLALVAVLTMTIAACDLPGGSSGGVSLTGYDQKAPKDIVNDAVSALKGAKNMSVKFSGKDSKGQEFGLTVTGDGNGNAKGSLTSDGVTADFVAVGGKTYIKGRAFWAKFIGTDAASTAILEKIGENYVVFPGGDFISSFKPFIDPAVFAECIGSLGNASRDGTDTVNGNKTVVLKSSDDAGSKLYIGIDAPHYPLRLSTTDAGKSFGSRNSASSKCSGSSPRPSASASGGGSADLTGTATLDLMDFGKTQDIKAPTNTVDLSTLAG